jgi:hypothetical protein
VTCVCCSGEDARKAHRRSCFPSLIPYAASVGDDNTPANPALLADVQMTSNAASSLSDEDENITIRQAGEGENQLVAQMTSQAVGSLPDDDDGAPQLKGLAAGKENRGAKRYRPEGRDGSEDESGESEDASDESDDDESEDESEVDIHQILKGASRVWSYAFIIALHNFYCDDSKEDNSAWNLGKVVVDKDLKAISVTRTAKHQPKELEGDPSITFHVEMDGEKHFHIMFDNFSGAMLVTVTGLSKSLPKLQTDKAWSNTMKIRRVYTSAEAVNRTGARRDKIRRNHTYLGEESLQKYANCCWFDDRCVNFRISFRSFLAPHPSKIPPN